MNNLNYLNIYTTDPAFNLAAEQYVFENLPKDRMYFMLWQNDNAIIIGKYQNTLAEINEKNVLENGMKVVRRLSGGGAVYHDLGNLNFTFIADAGELEELNMRVFCQPIVKALAKIGITAEINGRNDITIDGRKFSGNAQYMRSGRIMHHGTIMFDSNLEMVQKALNVDPSKIESKGKKSVRSRVTNIREYLREDISLEEFRSLLLDSILEDNPGEEYVFRDDDIRIIEQYKKERYDTWDWNYGRSPECSMQKSARIDGVGRIDAFISTDHSLITGLEFRGDFFSTEEPAVLAQRFIGCKADFDGYEKALEGVEVSQFFSGLKKEDFINLLLA